MDEQAILHRMADWGYYLLPKPHPQSLGHSGLLIAMRPKPTRLHFDPETLSLRLREGDTANWVILNFHSPLRDTQWVCPGRVTLTDRVDKHVTFFVFGGSLTADADPGEEVVYTLESPAPILDLEAKSDSLNDQFAAEVEMMLSVFQARWSTDDQGFAHHLAGLEPFSFYTACLESILMRYQRVHALQESYHELYATLLREKDWLIENGQWPARPLTLGDLLGVN